MPLLVTYPIGFGGQAGDANQSSGQGNHKRRGERESDDLASILQ